MCVSFYNKYRLIFIILSKMLIFLLLISLPIGECFWQKKFFRKISNPSVRNAFQQAYHRANSNLDITKRKVVHNLFDVLVPTRFNGHVCSRVRQSLASTSPWSSLGWTVSFFAYNVDISGSSIKTRNSKISSERDPQPPNRKPIQWLPKKSQSW